MAELDNDFLKSLNSNLDKMNGLLASGARAVQELRNQFSSLRQSMSADSSKKIVDATGVEQEMSKIQTVFDRVISDINGKAQKGGEELVKKLTNADNIRSEAQRSFEAIKQEYDKATKGINPMGAVALANMGRVDPEILSSAARKRYLKQQQEEAARLTGGPSQVSPELIRKQELAQQALNTATQRYNEVLQQVNAHQQKYAARASAIQGVSEKYQRISDQIQALRDKFAELYVKKEAKLIDDEKFKTQSDAIIKRYEELIREKNKFESGQDIDLAARSKAEAKRESEREKLEAQRAAAQQSKEIERSRLQEERAAAKERAQIAKEKVAAIKRENAQESKAIQEQIQLNRQITNLWKNYRQLQSSTPKSQWGSNKELTAARDKLKELLALSKELEKTNPGSRKIASQYLEYDKINNKLKEINSQHKQQKANLNNLLPTLQRLASAFGVAFSVQGLVNFGRKLIETRGEFELQQVALRSILQNKQLADEIWDKTMQAALQSPFTAMQLTRYTKQLAAYRIETEKLFDTTKMLADVSAGLGVDMQRLILAYGQVKAANYLRASEIRQFTEAGVNILGELSEYLTKTKGQMVSTAQVMDMVQKRMVKFEDVEAIFRKMTDEGGIFYNMQYVQSQTVKGQINKLHDAYDQMLNTIGKANQGTIRDFVAALNNVVRNWRGIAGTIKSIAWGAAIGFVAKYAAAITGLGTASMATKGHLDKLRISINNFGKSLKANLPFIAITAVVALTAKFIELGKAMEETNNEIDERNLRNYETRHNFEKLKEEIENNNKVIKENRVGTKALTEAQESNKVIMQKLRNEYPQLASQMDIATNSIIDMNGALDINIRKLNEQMSIMAMMKQMDIFSDSGKENLQEFESDLSAIKATLMTAQAFAQKQMMLMEQTGKEGEEMYQIYKKISEIDLSKNILEAREAFKELANQSEKPFLSKAWYVVSPGDYQRSWKKWFGISPSDLEYKHDTRQAIGTIEEQAAMLQTYYENGIKDNKDFLEKINNEYGGSVQKFIVANIKAVNDGTLTGINKANEVLINSLGPQTEEMKKWLNQYLNKLFGYYDEEEITRLRVLLQQKKQEALNHWTIALQADIDKLQEQLDASVTGVDFFSGQKDGNGTPDTETPEDKKSKIDAAWRRRIALLEEMKRRYDELSKSAFGYAKSEAEVREKFGNVFKDGKMIEKGSFDTIFAGTGITMDMIDFTSMEGMFKSFKLALQQAKGISDAFREDLLKKIDSYEVQIKIKPQKEAFEKFGKEMELAFSDYDLTLDLEKLSLPTGELEGIFDFDATTTKDLRKALDDFYNRQIAAGDDPENLKKQMEGYYKKVDEMERKSLVERLKTYTNYLTQGRDEAVQIHLEELKKMAELDELYAKGYYTDAQYKNISDAIRKETDEKLSKNEWKQFRESDYYVTMFEDLGNVATDSIDLMLERLKGLKNKLKDLDPTQVKEIVKAIDNLEKTKRARTPFKTFIDDIKTLRQWRQTGDRSEERDSLIERQKGLEKILGTAQELAAIYEKEYDDITHGLVEGNAEEARELWDNQINFIRELNGELKETNTNIANINKSNDEGYAAWKRTYEGVSKGAQYFSEMASTAGTIATEMMDMFDGIDDASKKLAHDIAEIAGNVAVLGGDIAKAIASEGTDIGSMIDGLVRTWNIIKGIFSASEASINRTIEKETILLEKLEWSLERVKKARDRAWDVTATVQAQKETEQAIRDQIAAYDALIAAESQRKNPDDATLRTWRHEREQLYEQLEEERDAFSQIFGGIGEEGYRSAAEEFVSAWKEAFLETGDGLQGLQDHFDEFLQEWFVKQATMRIAGKMLESTFNKIDAAVNEDSEGGVAVTAQELAAIRDKFAAVAPELSDALEQLAGMWDLQGEGGLSGLAAGIQGMTEEQANILEAYWNSVRMYTASIDGNVSRIADILGANGVNTNPQLQQLQTIAQNTQAIHTLLEGVTVSGHPQGGRGIKVFSN